MGCSNPPQSPYFIPSTAGQRAAKEPIWQPSREELGLSSMTNRKRSDFGGFSTNGIIVGTGNHE